MGKLVEFKCKENLEIRNQKCISSVIPINSFVTFFWDAGLVTMEDLDEVLGNDRIFYIKGFSVTKFFDLRELLILALEAQRIEYTKNIEYFLSKSMLKIPACDKTYIHRDADAVNRLISQRAGVQIQKVFSGNNKINK